MSKLSPNTCKQTKVYLAFSKIARVSKRTTIVECVCVSSICIFVHNSPQLYGWYSFVAKVTRPMFCFV